MRYIGVIPTRVHGVLDYLFGLVLIGSPWLFQFDYGTVETWLPVVLGGGILLYSLFTDYEISIARRIPMWAHLLIDMLGGLLLAVSPWLFRFDNTVSLPHVLLGTAVIAAAVFTSARSTDASVAGVERDP
jgi:hypothetical protein